MVEWLLNLNSQLNAIVWGPPILILIIGGGLYLTIRTGFSQFTQFGRMTKEVLKSEKRETDTGDITPFQAISVAMGGTVGVGNIAGVATAIALGGPGALFWMLISGVVGMCTKLVEVLLGVHFRVQEPGGPMLGGTMMVIERGLGKSWRWLAVLFSLFGALAAFGIGNMVQANSVAKGMLEFGVDRWVTGLILIVAIGLVTIGGIKRIAQVAQIIVPFMIITYMIGGLIVIFARIGTLPSAIADMFRYAFTPMGAMGGFAGATVAAAMRRGIARGVFSNEAGMGSAPMAHATARTDHPARQSLWGIFEVFMDTIVVCMITGLAILTTGAYTAVDAAGQAFTGAALTIHAFEQVMPAFGALIVVGGMLLTSYDTNLAWCFYGETCGSYLWGGKIRTPYRLLWLPFVMIGALGELVAIWDIADTLNGLMMIPNMIAILLLSGLAAKLLSDFLKGQPYKPPT
ncbi:MAG: Amino-acid carrier protein AlsT [candidate division WS2 bacterium]|nr:Amino-acid carrier protein AlsT [Candidatus Psychracetigena formicireducens]